MDFHIILFGPPGSGKGTQAEHLCDRFGLIHLSTGDLFREAARNRTSLGRKAEDIMKAGELVPDDIVTGVVLEKLRDHDQRHTRFLFDGYPRNITQAKALDAFFEKMRFGKCRVIHLNVPDEEVMRRLSGRRICRKCGKNYNIYSTPPGHDGSCDVCDGELYQRPDDNKETIAQRLNVYREQTRPLFEYYAAQSMLVDIDGMGTMGEVAQCIEAALGKL